MLFVPIRALSPCEVASLGNNIRPVKRAPDEQVQAVNRSLAIVDEKVGRLYATPAAWGYSAPISRPRRRSA